MVIETPAEDSSTNKTSLAEKEIENLLTHSILLFAISMGLKITKELSEEQWCFSL